VASGGFFDAVRIGRRLYMDNRAQIAAGADVACLPIKEVASFRSEIVAVKTVKTGERADTASITERRSRR
jgi:alanine racemase